MKKVTTGPGGGTFEGCVSKCFDANVTNAPWLISDIDMKCSLVMGIKSCKGTIKYTKVTLNKGELPKYYDTSYCKKPRELKSGDKEVPIKLKVEDCLKVTSSSGKVTQRCDQVYVQSVHRYDPKYPKSLKYRNASKYLIISEYHRAAEVRFLAAKNVAFTYFHGDNICVNLLPVEKNITASGIVRNYLIKTCNLACADYEEGAWSEPAVVTYYKELINIGQSQTITMKTLKFFAAAGVISPPPLLLFMLWIIVIIISKLM